MSHSEKLDELYDIVDDLETAMFVSENTGELRSRPMKTYIDKETGKLWFITKMTSGKISEIGQDHSVNLAYGCPKSHKYVSISGRATVSRDASKIDWMWSDETATWFKCEKTDPNIAAICVTPTTAEYWDAPSSSIVRTWEIAKAKLTGDTPDLGENAKVRMTG